MNTSISTLLIIIFFIGCILTVLGCISVCVLTFKLSPNLKIVNKVLKLLYEKRIRYDIKNIEIKLLTTKINYFDKYTLDIEFHKKDIINELLYITPNPYAIIFIQSNKELIEDIIVEEYIKIKGR